MADGIYVAQDPGGFGRLADVAFKKRAEARQERQLGMQERRLGMQEQEQALKMATLRQNLQQIEADQNFRAGLRQYMATSKENPFVAQYSYAKAHGRSDMMQKLHDTQFEHINRMHDDNPELAARLANETLLKVGAIPEPWVYNPSARKTTMGKTEILDDGTTIIATDTGPQVYAPSGELLSGEVAANKIKQAREYEVEQERQKTAGREIGKFGGKEMGKYYNRLDGAYEKMAL
jgi:hypothetical protein